MEEKKYLKWYNKVGYGSGDIAGNVVYAFLSSFVMIYLTNTVGLNAGIVGTLIAVSKLFDGVTDVFFGSMIDKTKSRMGKARPWMLYGYIGCAVTLAAIFAIPVNMGKTAQYAWFFIAYTLLNAVFYTANNIAYSALTALVTKNSRERVEMGSYRFIFAFSTSLLIQSVTIKFVAMLGGGAAGWRTAAVIYAIIGLVVNTISVLSVKELPEEELNEDHGETDEKYSLLTAAKLLVSNKFYLIICVTYILQQIYTAMLNMGIYYMTYVLLNENLYPLFSWAINIPLIIALIITPALVEKWKGIYRLNLCGYVIGTLGRALVVVAAYLGSVPLMLVFTGIAAFGMGPWQGDMNAVIANCSEYTYLTKQKRVDGTMYSCTSLGIKLGGGLGIAITGWLLEFSGFDGTAAVQSASCMNMLHIMYLWIPVAISLIITFLMSKMNVEKANAGLRNRLEEHTVQK
ncbi:transporter, major facilitator family protein [Marvinbryantia formatexigens DSM 14469]|uniref:Transporter, major facilitator family protein n=1 Tax=Marvinbryantia formatexigens DSM 14469 TaxID=478749 RepID=C6LF16_9FIRM|nr:MFS transporter [Marvinbryantia formatexigens]EET60755.1 transporter, major facilitator family protein [Marvinbryantia formatexigens DSM 14469]UWO26897.1 MFS transporter [Marvinbryantia formatexigens DSM 14469]SDG33444.1 glycoside/pentoside/hexuronide:cation symporter, GPH family [Marvinbryantia formatexigens]